MSKKLLEAYYNLQEGALDNLLEEVKEQYIENCLYGGFSGWTQDIILTEDGELFLTGAMSNGSMLMSTYKGTSMVLSYIQCHYENDFQIEEYCIDNLTDEEQDKLFKELVVYLDLNEYSDEEDDERFESIYDVLSKYPIETEEKFKELFESQYDKLLKEHIEGGWTYEEERIMNAIDENIEYLRREVEEEE